VSKWENELDAVKMAEVMRSDRVEEELEAEGEFPHAKGKSA